MSIFLCVLGNQQCNQLCVINKVLGNQLVTRVRGEIMFLLILYSQLKRCMTVVRGGVVMMMFKIQLEPATSEEKRAWLVDN